MRRPCIRKQKTKKNVMITCRAIYPGPERGRTGSRSTTTKLREKKTRKKRAKNNKRMRRCQPAATRE